MDQAESFVASLKKARLFQSHQQHVRTKLRSEFMSAVQRDRERSLQAERHRDASEHVGMTTLAEENLLGDLRKTIKWWNILSDHAIEQKLKFESAQESKIAGRTAYLESIMNRELAEERNVIESDKRRWELAKQSFEEVEQQNKQDAIREIWDAVFGATFQSVSTLEENQINFNEHNILAQFLVQDEVRKIASNPQNISAEDVYQFIYGKENAPSNSETDISHPSVNVTNKTSAEVATLLDLLYHMCDDKQKAPCFFEICRSPIFIIDGPKYSGKSLLTKELSTQRNFTCFTDIDLITRAITASTASPTPTLEQQSSSQVKEEADSTSAEGGSDKRVEESNEGKSTEPSPSPIPAGALEGEQKSDESENAPVDVSTKKKNNRQEWIEVGGCIQEALWRGESVSSKLMGELFRLVLETVPQECQGVVVDGIIQSADEYRIVEETLLPEVKHPYENVYNTWISGTPLLDNEEARALWEVEKVRFGEVAKKESKPKAPRKGVDLSQLPPPTLPEVVNVDALIAKEQAFIEKAKKELEPYGVLFSAIVHVSCSPQEIFERFAGLRIDEETGEEYHMVYAPPPKERLPFLLNFDRTKANTAQLHDVVFNQEQQWRAFHQWLRGHKGAIDIVHEMNGNRSVPEIMEDLTGIITSALSTFAIGKKLYESMKDSEEHVEALRKQRETQEKLREAERQRLVAIYTEKGVPIPQELELNEETGGTFPIPEEIPDMVLQTLDTLTTPYLEQYAWAWENWGQLTKELLQYRSFVHKQIGGFWVQPDGKQTILQSFVKQFNEMSPSFRSSVSCKEELHHYVDELTNALFYCNTQRRGECHNLLSRVTRKELFIDEWEGNVCNVAITLVHAEMERFSSLANLVLVYFSTLIGEPMNLDKFESELALIKATGVSTVRLDGHGVNLDLSANSRTAKDKKPQSKKGHPKVDEVPEKGVEEVFTETVSKLLTTMLTLVERVKATTDITSSKALKRGVVTPSMQKLALIAARALGPIEAEHKLSKGRIERLQEFVSKTLTQGQMFFQNIKVMYQREIQQKFKRDAACINTAIYTIRGCIEEEKPSPLMHLGFATFSTCGNAVDNRGASSAAQTPQRGRDPSFITDVPLTQQIKGADTPIHATLDFSRLMKLIYSFKSSAPDYSLSRSDFLTLVKEEDYRGAALPGQTLVNVKKMFSNFDPASCGVIDWREFVMHLMFYCVPPLAATVSSASGSASLYIPEATVEQLVESRANLGWNELTEEEFFDVPFYFDSAMSDERLEAYTKALWATFSRAKTNMLIPSDLLWFLCLDAQPIRGVQKAFYVFSGADDGRLGLPEMEMIFHIKVGTPVGSYDPFSKVNLELLFKGRETISFQETCLDVMGRKMLNCSQLFQRKAFVSDF